MYVEPTKIARKDDSTTNRVL